MDIETTSGFINKDQIPIIKRETDTMCMIRLGFFIICFLLLVLSLHLVSFEYLTTYPNVNNRVITNPCGKRGFSLPTMGKTITIHSHGNITPSIKDIKVVIQENSGDNIISLSPRLSPYIPNRYDGKLINIAPMGKEKLIKNIIVSSDKPETLKSAILQVKDKYGRTCFVHNTFLDTKKINII